MKRRLISAFFCCLGLCLIAYQANAQCSTVTCTDPVAAYDAPSACILPSPQSLDCFFGQMINNTPISLPPYWCTTVENNQWLAFTATSTDVVFDIEALNCQSGGAIQAALLETADCVNFNFVSDCLGNIPSGSTQTLTNNVPLQIGQVYYLMLDGSAGASCGYSINGPGSIVSGASTVCLPSASSIYTTATTASWSIVPSSGGSFLGPSTGKTVNINWTQTGTFQVCAQSTTCPNVPTYCMVVEVGESIQQTNMVTICTGDSVVCGGQTYTSGGTFTSVLPGPICDTVVTCIVNQVPPSFTNLGIFDLPCDGSYEICGVAYNSIGVYFTTCTGWQGCDSNVYFILSIGDVYSDVGADLEISCSNPQVTLSTAGSSQGSEFSYEWTGSDGQIISNSASDIVVDAVGTYCLTVYNTTSGCQMTDCLAVTQAQSVPVITIAPTTVPCDGSEVSLVATASTGPGTSFAWSTGDGLIGSGENTSSPMIAAPGTYCVTVTDMVGCTNSKCINIGDEISIGIIGPNVYCTEGVTLTHQVNTFSGAFFHDLFLQFGNGAAQQIHQTSQQASYDWDNVFSAPTTLTVWANDSTGCTSDTLSFFVDENMATLLFDQQQTECNTATLSAQLVGNLQNTATEWMWSNGSTNASTVITSDGWYFVTATDNYGCQWVDSILATINFTGNCAYVEGDVLISADDSCQPTSNDLPANGFLVRAVGTGGTYYATTDVNGHYFMPVGIGSYTVSVLFSPSILLSACANGQSVDVPNIGDNANLSFLLQQPPNCPVMSANIGASFLRRCFNNTYHISYCNNGSGTASDAYIDLVLDPAISFISSTLPATALGNNTYRFELGYVSPGECGLFSVQGSIGCNVPLGQLHCSSVHIYPDTLCVPQQLPSFEEEDCRVNIGSYDPNTLSATPPGTGFLHKVEAGTNLTYRVQFQNIGTDTAFQVTILDTLPDAFDFETLQGGASSFPYTMEFFGDRVLKFTFDGINLPPIGTNEAGSIGFVDFDIRLRPDLALLSTVENTAAIYFDFNEPVLTNTYFHTIGLPVLNTYLSATVCEGSSYIFNGEPLEQAGDFSATYTTALGCDSIVHLSLTVLPAAETNMETGICEGESYAFNGQVFTQAGDYEFTFTNLQGCDSIVNLALEVWPQAVSNFSAAICTGASYEFQGQLLTQSGNYQAMFYTVHGCDSIVNLSLTVTDVVEVETSESICQGESLPFGSQLLTGPGIYHEIFQSSGGCDSSVTLNLAILPIDTFSMNVLACEGDSFEYNNDILTDEGIYTYHFIGQNSCDSVVLLSISFEEIEHSSFKVFICEGETFVMDGQEYTAAGMYEVWVDDPNGCPDLVTLYLDFYPNSPVTDITVEVIEGTVFNGVLFQGDTVLTEILEDENGCDSTIAYHVMALPNSTGELSKLLGFNLFPNPTNGDLFVQFDLPSANEMSIEAVDVTGRRVCAVQEISCSPGSHQIKISTKEWASGVYFLHFSTSNAQLVRKVVVE